MKRDFKSEVNRVRDLIAGLFNEVPSGGDQSAADSLKEYTTDSGAIYKIDKLEPGGKVYDIEGVNPIVMGFTLADGTVVAVDESGTITAVTVPVVDPLALEAEPAAPAAPAEPQGNPNGIEARLAALEGRFASQEQTITVKVDAEKFTEQINALKENHAAQIQKYSDTLNQVLDLVSKFAEQSSDDAAQKPAQDGDTTTKAQRRETLAKNIAARKTLA